MGRLAVDQKFKGQGLGGALLADALHRAFVSDIAAYAMLADAKDIEAAAFYPHHGFISLSDSPLSFFFTACHSIRDLTPVGRYFPPKNEHVKPYQNINSGKECQRQMPKKEMVYPGLDERLAVTRSACGFLQLALPGSQKTVAPQHGLYGNDGKGKKVQSAPPENSYPCPVSPCTQGNDG
jgi:hypothetical protein